jgi:hypothetical protein
MADDRPFATREIDQLRVEIASLETALGTVMEQLARLPTRRQLAETALLAMTGGSGLAIFGWLLIGR